jgi:CubicO group peptidase (beta-lactamase class C family)
MMAPTEATTAPASTPAPARTPWREAFEAYAAGIVAKHRIPGVAVAAALNGETVYEGGFGFRNAEQELPVTAETIFGLGSVSKSFTAVAVLQLQEAGVLSVADPVVC